MNMISTIIFIYLSIVYVHSLPHRRPVHNVTCPVTGGILCILDEFKIVKSLAEAIAHKSSDIERHIRVEKSVKIDNKYVQADLEYTRLFLPKPYYHINFSLENNIDKRYLTKLILEGHDTMMFFYNSISDLINSNSLFSQTTDEWFSIILNNIEDGIICRYRRILDVYNRKWKPNNQTHRMQFLKKNRLPPSDVHYVHSLVIAIHLKEWMKYIDHVIKNLPLKYA